MAHITGNISISDGLATPVARAFVPKMLGVDHSVFAYIPAAALSRKEWITYSVDFSDSSAKRSTLRQKQSVMLPIVRNINGVQTVIATARAELTFILPDEASAAEASDLYAFMRNGMAEPAFKNGVTLREPIFG